MRSAKVGLAAILFFTAIFAIAASKMQTFTGEVSDAMCGAEHMMANKAECTRACVAKGSKYALVVGKKVYTLDATSKSALDQLNSLAGEKASVTGSVNGDTIEVSKVAQAK